MQPHHVATKLNRMGAIAGDLEALCRGCVPFPGCGVHVHIRTPNAVVGSASCDCTGLGGHDLGVSKITISVFALTNIVSPFTALL